MAGLAAGVKGSERKTLNCVVDFRSTNPENYGAVEIPTFSIHVITPASGFTRSATWLLLLSSLQAACSSGVEQLREPGDSTAVVVYSAAAKWEGQDNWYLSPEPTLIIEGGADQAPLMGVRGPIMTSEGNLVLANAATNDLRIYSAAGALLKVSGRRGNGPGEFPMGPFALYGCGADTIIARENRRVSIWRTDGEYVGTSSTQSGKSDRLRTVICVSADCGSVLVETGDLPRPDDPVVRVENRLFWLERNGTSGDTLIRYHGIEAIRVDYRGRQFRSRVPWSPTPVYAVRDSFLVFGNADQPVFELWIPPGR